MNLPHVTPMPLARFDAPFDHPDWIFEPKMDGFRAVAYVEGGACRLVSRNRNAFKAFEPLAQAGQDLFGRVAILDGEIVRTGADSGQTLAGRQCGADWPGFTSSTASISRKLPIEFTPPFSQAR